MKQIFFALTLTLLLLGCSEKNGFSDFGLTPKQEKWENNRITAPLKNGKKTVGTVTVVYLNKVAPQLYNNGEYFYVELYTKDDANDTQCSLNGKISLLKEEIDGSKEFAKYTPKSAKWDRVYLIGFMQEKDSDILQLIVTHNGYNSTPLIFKKDE